MRIGLTAAALLIGCGDPIAPGSYRGEPLAQFPSMNRIAQPPDRALLAGIEDGMRAALFWAPADAQFDEPGRWIEQPSTGGRTALLQLATISLYDAAPAEALHDGYALGRVLSYPDANGNQRRDPTEPWTGLSDHLGLIYAPEALAAHASPTGHPLPAGHHLVLLPIPALCERTAPERTGPICDVPLGTRCATDADCRMGYCVHNATQFWANGACVIPPDLDDCTPATTAFSPLDGFFVQPCGRPQDCTRPGYRCDEGVGGCVPDEGLPIIVGRAPTGSGFCPELPSDAPTRPPRPASPRP